MRHSNKLFAVLLIMITIFTFVGCERNSDENFNTKIEYRAYELGNPPINMNNPYDYIGESHNEKLITFIDSVNLHNDDRFKFSYEKFYVKGLPNENIFTNIINLSNSEPDNYTGLMDSLYKVYPDLYEHYFVIRNIVNDTTILTNKINALISYENSLNSTNLNKDNLMALQSTFSVARYSLYLWSTKEEGGLGYRKEDRHKDYIGGSKETHDIVMADIGGTFTSALFTWNPFTALAGGAASSAWEWASN